MTLNHPTSEAAPMKITPFLVDRYLLVRVYTDAGIVGNGEAGLWAHHGPEI